MSFTLDEPEAKENIQVNADVDDLKKIQNQGNYEIGLDESIVYITVVMRKKMLIALYLFNFLI